MECLCFFSREEEFDEYFEGMFLWEEGLPIQEIVPTMLMYRVNKMLTASFNSHRFYVM